MKKVRLPRELADLVRLGGGTVTDKPTIEKIVGQQLPDDFNGPCWVAGSVSPWP